MKPPKFPSPPRSLCGSWLHWILGIHSPSKEMIFFCVGPRNKYEEKYQRKRTDYFAKMNQYKLHSRTMTKSEWTDYYRKLRTEKCRKTVKMQC